MIWGQYVALLQSLLLAGTIPQVVTVSGDPLLVDIDPLPLPADKILLEDSITIDTPQNLVRIAAYLDGIGNSDGPGQFLRGEIYDNSTGLLVAATDESFMTDGSIAQWMSLTFPVASQLLPGDYRFGIHASVETGVANYYLAAATGGNTAYSSPYFAGAPASLPGGGVRTAQPALFYLETIGSVRIPTGVTDDYLASLPFDLTQRVFLAAGVIRSSIVAASVSWYGAKFDPTGGSVAIVRSDGPLAGLVGERVLITRRGALKDRQVAVYIFDEREFPDGDQDQDIMLSARAFLALGDQALDSLPVTVGILA